MLKRVLVAALVLLLTATPVVLAQDMSQQPGLGQSQYVNQTQYVPPNLNDLAQLDANNNLIINCGALIQRLAQLEQVSADTLASDLQLRLAMLQAEDLAQLCRDKGYTSPGSGQTSGSNPTNVGS